MSTITLTPNRGRDYDNTLALQNDLAAGRDFIVADMSSRWDGKPCNVHDLRRAGVTHAKVRYQRLRKVAVVELAALA